jgi:hypothetical protein
MNGIIEFSNSQGKRIHAKPKESENDKIAKEMNKLVEILLEHEEGANWLTQGDRNTFFFSSAH